MDEWMDGQMERREREREEGKEGWFGRYMAGLVVTLDGNLLCVQAHLLYIIHACYCLPERTAEMVHQHQLDSCSEVERSTLRGSANKVSYSRSVMFW